MGFQHMPEVVLKAASRKGGKVRKPKGLAKLPPEKRREIATKGGQSGNRSSKGAKQTPGNRGDDSQRLADVLGNLND